MIRTRIWVAGLVRRRAGRLGVAATGVAAAAALLASLGAFLVSSQASMTSRAVRDVTVDWQVQVQPGADLVTVLDTVRAAADTAQAVPVGFGQADGLTATTGMTTQTTGTTVALGLPDTYRATFPGTVVAAQIQARSGASATVTDIAHTRSRVGSSLTAVDLGFALVLAAAAGGLVLSLGLAERRRMFAITTALGATRRQLRGLVTAEATVLTVGGLMAGAAVGWLLSQVLDAVLTGVFDPPPAAATVPRAYLGIAVTVTLGDLGLATLAALQPGRRPPVAVKREL